MESNNGMEKTLKKKHFVLVHGACHGAWSWYKVVALLRAEGHRVTALDMAAAGVHPTLVEELRSFSDYCKPLMEFMATLPPDDTVVLVGHSMGGISISVAMEMFPRKISVAIFVTAFMPAPHLNVPAIIQEGGTVVPAGATGRRKQQHWRALRREEKSSASADGATEKSSAA
ncbi:Methylesterase 2 [Abeliophyllum distichum]|uniref:Methylesterase 2 n=1 Tax=Abeliophyllum distichum TaxID=126358 RepID=A0ABD1V565_9LAMI